jgi:hypothetical protein
MFSTLKKSHFPVNIRYKCMWRGGFTHKFKELLQDLHIYANNFFFHLTLPRDIWVSEKAAFWFLESLWENAKINQANRRSRFIISRRKFI